MNFIPDERKLDFLQNYVTNNLKFHTDEIGNDLRQEISRGILNGETTKTIISRVKKVFDDKKYSNRIKTVLRTETLRANNTGALDGAERSGLKLKKWLDVMMDEFTSDICKKENRKYGSPDKAIPLDQEFIVKVDNKTVRGLSPPFHVNCRTVIRFERVRD
jgi:hypothetical protein